MTPEQKVTSLELSRKLSKSGAKQESYYFWAEYVDGAKHLYRTDGNAPSHSHQCSAFDCEELLERVPKGSDVGSRNYGFAAILGSEAFEDLHSPSEALGKLYLWGLENGEIKEEK